ncbi:hypothetical protein A2U01_0022198, partial [Trifolium medium]|nr:hypothetical protein [Trifolium medium]
PSLALRQLGYPVLNIPTMDKKDLFVIRDYTIEHTVLLRRICKSWHKVVKKGREIGPRSCHANKTYRDWVMNRALEVKLPFHCTISAPEEIIVEPFNNIEDLESDLSKRDQKIIEELQKELEKVQQAYRDLKYEKDQQSLDLENVCKRAREEEDKRRKTREGLWAANTELSKRNREKNMAVSESRECQKKLKVSCEKKDEYQIELEDLRQQLRSVRAEYESKITIEREQTGELIDAYQTALAKKEEEMHEQEGIIEEELIDTHSHARTHAHVHSHAYVQISNDILYIKSIVIPEQHYQQMHCHPSILPHYYQ